ncbi:MAG: hypothetical protein QG582_1194 [Candidatus Thermoplasmatota archaeon]|nr:hypothetical protein [Candidatus Thermoplasmatota archaeon]
MGGLGPYPQPYTMQDEQRVEPRREKRVAPQDRRADIMVLVGVSIIIASLFMLWLWGMGYL